MMSLLPVTDRFGETPDTDVHDAPLQLRQWGTDLFKLLPHTPVKDGWLIGTSSECVFRLADRLSAPKHAQVMCEGERWWLRDLGTPHGIRRDGVPCRECLLTPGLEIGIGGTVLVVESVRTVALRSFLQRLLGWGDDRLYIVDQALRAMRQLVAQRAPLILRGDGDLVPIAETLHRLAFGDSAPFVVCDPRRENTPASVRSAANCGHCREAFMSAIGGSICIRRRRLPPGLGELMQRLYLPDSEVRLFVCDGPSYGETFGGSITIELPPLQMREIEVPRIIDEYATDAIRALLANVGYFTDVDHQWVRRHSAMSIPDIAKGTLRVVALNKSATLGDAARRLCMAPVSLVRWIERRGPLPHRQVSLPSRAARAAPRSTMKAPSAMKAPWKAIFGAGSSMAPQGPQRLAQKEHMSDPDKRDHTTAEYAESKVAFRQAMVSAREQCSQLEKRLDTAEIEDADGMLMRAATFWLTGHEVYRRLIADGSAKSPYLNHLQSAHQLLLRALSRVYRAFDDQQVRGKLDDVRLMLGQAQAQLLEGPAEGASTTSASDEAEHP
jgi:FHA domain-containing protein